MGNHSAASANAGGSAARNRAAESTNASQSHSRSLSLPDWPVSRRLFAVIVMALVMGVAFGGLRIVSAESSADQFSRVSQLANLNQRLIALVQALQTERDETLSLLASGNAQPLTPLYAQTDRAVAAVQQSAAGIGSDFPVNIQNDVTTVNADISGPRIRALHSLLNSPQDDLAVITTYGADINDMITLADQVGQGVSDANLVNDVRALNALSLAKEQVSQQRAMLNYAFSNPVGDPASDVLVDTNTEQAMQISFAAALTDETVFLSSATPAEEAFFNNSLGSPAVAQNVAYAQQLETSVFAYEGLNGSPLLTSVQGLTVPGGTTFDTLAKGERAWDTGMGDELSTMQSTETLIAGNITGRAGQLQSGAQQSAVISGIITVAVLLLVLLAALLVARSLVLPLRRLRAGALDVASVQLPESIRQLSKSTDGASPQVTPIDVLSRDEIGQVARAFDQVHAEAIRLAGQEALLRATFNAIFVNLSRRSQSLIERLAYLIDSLEQNEEDPDRLSNLFSMDHLVTRMRRNSENLLLLAGHEGARKWSEPVPVADVARASISEIERYKRVVLSIQPGVAVIGQAVSDIVHLLAELIENATEYSPENTRVHVSAQELTSGGVLIEVTDKGIGIPEARLAEINWRLDSPPVLDVSVSRHMGLFAVARLAERHRVRVRLRPASPQGLTALVLLPDSVIVGTTRSYDLTGGWRPLAMQGGLQDRRVPGHSGAQPGAGRQGHGRRSPGMPAPADDAYATGPSDTMTGPGQHHRDGPGPGPTPAGPVQAASPPASNWFSGSRTTPGIGTGASGTDSWGEARSPAVASADPIPGEEAATGAPAHLPSANPIPWSAAGTPTGSRPHADPTGSKQDAPQLPQRSPEMARSRLAAFQRGTRDAKEQASLTEEGTDR